jgi:hypothetical protein
VNATISHPWNCTCEEDYSFFCDNFCQFFWKIIWKLFGNLEKKKPSFFSFFWEIKYFLF